MSEVEYEFVTSAGDVGKPPELRREPIILPEWPKENGKAHAFYINELGTGEHNRYADSDKVFDEAGNVTRLKGIPYDVRFLAYVTRDPGRNRIWQTVEQAQDALEFVGKSITNKMVVLAQEVNYGDPKTKTVDEAVARAEGNSEETPTSS